MTSNTASSLSFSAAPNGWRAALGDPQEKDITVVPIIGWQTTGENTSVEPVVLFDNTREPVISTVRSTLADWSGGSYLHQILAPGIDLRDVPEGWTVADPYQA